MPFVVHLGHVLGVEHELLRAVLLERERALARDADGDHVVFVPIDRLENAARRRTADGVLGRPAPEQDGDGQLGHGHSPWGVGSVVRWGAMSLGFSVPASTSAT